jgi:hypothetical protein
MPANLELLICFGQDKCVFKQLTFVPKAWTAPDGQKSMIPKDEGLGVMTFAFASREFGFGHCVSLEHLELVKEEREGTHHSDEEAAMKTKGNALKAPLTESPFVVEFEHAASNQGRWDCDHKIMQFEDCVDVVKTLRPEFVFMFLFDHSCGHDRQQPDGLHDKGEQNSWRHPANDEKKQDGSRGTNWKLPRCSSRGQLATRGLPRRRLRRPFYASEAEREATNFDRRTGSSTRKM